MISAGQPIDDDLEVNKFADLNARREPAMNGTGARAGWDNRAVESSAPIATTPNVNFARSHEIRIDDSHRVLVPTAADGLGVRVRLIAGALIAASGLTWIVIGALPSPFASISVRPGASLNSPVQNLDSNKGDRLPIPNAIIREAVPASSREIAVALAPPAPLEPKHSTDAKGQTASIRKHLKDAEQQTTNAQDLQAPAKLVPVPETRPTTIEGWTLREVINGTAVLEGPNGTWRAMPGDTVPGVGRIDSIFRWGNRLMVATSRGLISTP
ncbi:MAG TPA: hypothetical protein VHT68_16945 [Pseudolabrys sp.]|nr:hypothetical protein [Pseudolabrys sp.]